MATLVLGLTGCGSSGGRTSTASPSTSSTSQPGGPRITSFVVPKFLRCGAVPRKSVRVIYAVSGAKRHQLIIDGRVAPGAAAPRATVHPLVHCDGGTHTVALVAIDAQGRRTSAVRYLATRLTTTSRP